MINIPTEIIKIGKIQKKISNDTSQVFHPETEIAQIVDFPEIYNNDGKYLTTNGSELSWSSVDALPSQSGNSGKFLTTDGNTARWSTVNTGSVLPSQTDNAGKVLMTDGTDTSWVSLNTIEEIFNVNSTTSAITLTNASNSTTSESLSVYHDGLRLVNTVDYTYNSSTKVITFNRAFLDGDQVVVYIGPEDLGVSSLIALPDQTGNSGKFLTTNGNSISWSDIHPSEPCIINSNASGSISLNIDTTSVYKLLVTGNISFSFIKDSTLSIYNTNRSTTLTLLIQNGGNYTIAWPNNVYWPNNIAPSLSVDNNYDVITLITFDSGSTWIGNASTNYTIL